MQWAAITTVKIVPTDRIALGTFSRWRERNYIYARVFEYINLYRIPTYKRTHYRTWAHSPKYNKHSGVQVALKVKNSKLTCILFIGFSIITLFSSSSAARWQNLWVFSNANISALRSRRNSCKMPFGCILGQRFQKPGKSFENFICMNVKLCKVSVGCIWGLTCHQIKIFWIIGHS